MYIGENVNKFHKVEVIINNRQRRAIFARHALRPRSSLHHYHHHHTNACIKPPRVHTTLGIHEPHPVTVSFTSKPCCSKWIYIPYVLATPTLQRATICLQNLSSVLSRGKVGTALLGTVGTSPVGSDKCMMGTLPSCLSH